MSVDREWVKRLLAHGCACSLAADQVKALYESFGELLEEEDELERVRRVLAKSPRYDDRDPLEDVAQQVVDEHADAASVVDSVMSAKNDDWAGACGEIRERLRQYDEVEEILDDRTDFTGDTLDERVEKLASALDEKSTVDVEKLEAVKEAARDLLEDIDEKRASVYPLWPLRSALRELMSGDPRAPALRFD